MAFIIKCLDAFTNPRELDGAAIRDGLSVGSKQLRKFVVFASRGSDTLVVIGPPFDPMVDKHPEFYFHKDIRAVAGELYGRKDIAGGGFAFFLCEQINGVREEGAILNGESSEFGVYPSDLAGPAGVRALSAWYGALVTVA
jgi:hypothetical protein